MKIFVLVSKYSGMFESAFNNMDDFVEWFDDHYFTFQEECNDHTTTKQEHFDDMLSELYEYDTTTHKMKKQTLYFM